MPSVYELQKQRVVALLCLVLLAASTATAEVVFDGTIGAPLAGEFRAGNFTISEADGQLSGPNLFHSFDTFHVRVDETASFTHDTASVQNIIGRVTGSSNSLIDGTIISDANLWLANPNGLLVSSTAFFDINGSLNLGSAEFLLVEDGTTWDLFGPELTTSLAPLDFATIGTEGGIAVDGTVIFASGDVRIVGGQLVAVTDVDIDTSSFDASSGGSLVIAGDQVRLENSFLSSPAFADGAAGNITVSAATDLTISNSTLNSDSEGAFDAGTITLVSSNSMDITNSFITSDATATGNAGIILLEGGDIDITGTDITSDAVRAGFVVGDAGASAGYIQINGENVTLADTIIFADTVSASQGAAFPGEIRITATNTIDISAGSTFGANTFGEADAGQILMAADVLSISDSRIESTTASSGFAGLISLTGNTTLSIADDITTELLPSLSSSSTGSGNAGVVALFGGDIIVTDTEITSDAFTSFGSTTATGAPGFIQIEGESVALAGANLFAESQSSSVPGEPNDSGLFPGEIRITANSVIELSEQTTIGTSTYGSGPAGQIFVVVGSFSEDGELALSDDGALRIMDNSSIASSSFSSGDAGFVGVAASGVTITSSDIASNAFPEITDDTPSGVEPEGFTGAAGFIQIFGGDIALADTNVLAQSQSGETGGPVGPGGQLPGEIQIVGSNSIDISTGTLVSTNTFGGATAGTVQIGDPETGTPEISIAGNSSVQSSTFAEGDAGNITLSGGAIRLSGDEPDPEASVPTVAAASRAAATGFAGSIFISGDSVELDSNALVTSSSETTGDAGIVQLISSGEVALTNSSITSDAFPVDLNPDGSIPAGATGAAAGLIQIEGENLTFTSSQVFADTFTNPPGMPGAGLVSLTASNTIDVLAGSEIGTNTFGTGDAGRVQISTDLLRINDAGITSESLGQFEGAGDSGFVDLDIGTRLSMQNGGVISTDSAFSQGGDILVTTLKSEIVLQGSTISASAGANGDGGNIELESELLVLEKSNVLARAESGFGGFINIDGKLVDASVEPVLRSEITVIQDFNSRISADSDTGTAGTVEIAAPVSDISAIVATQSVDTLDAPELASSRCDRSAGKSRLTSKPTGSVLAAPDAHISIKNGAAVGRGRADISPIFTVACNHPLGQQGVAHE